jgi:hypothetical protein
VPAAEPSSFLAGVAFIGRLGPAEVVDALETRAAALDTELAGHDVALSDAAISRHPVLSALDPPIVRLLLLDADYLRAIRLAELAWVNSLLAELRSGSLAWDFDDIVGQVRTAESRHRAGR